MKFLGAFKSAAAAFFGVQKSEVHEQDFSSKSPIPFIVAGIILAVALVLAVVFVVQLVVP